MRQFIKKNMKQLMRRLGYDIVRSDCLEQWAFAHHLGMLFKELNVQSVLDVGANIGGYRDFLRQIVGYEGLIISFEPVEKNLKVLQAKAKLDARWAVYGFALGSQNTTMEINVMKNHVFSSFLNPDHSVVNHLIRGNSVDYTERVEVKRLDSVMEMLKARHGIGANMYLKIDTQGYDLEVVEGAGETLSTFLALQTEISMRKIYENMPDFTETVQILKKKGFEITGTFAVSRDPLKRVIEFDCVMTNRTLEVPASLQSPSENSYILRLQSN